MIQAALDMYVPFTTNLIENPDVAHTVKYVFYPKKTELNVTYHYNQDNTVTLEDVKTKNIAFKVPLDQLIFSV